jgi:hypothetical protein
MINQSLVNVLQIIIMLISFSIIITCVITNNIKLYKYALISCVITTVVCFFNDSISLFTSIIWLIASIIWWRIYIENK